MFAGKKLDPMQQIAQGKARDKAAKAIGVKRQYVSDAKKINKADSHLPLWCAMARSTYMKARNLSPCLPKVVSLRSKQ
jgi:hypothetical protein